jgi:hypothetical protein
MSHKLRSKNLINHGQPSRSDGIFRHAITILPIPTYWPIYLFKRHSQSWILCQAALQCLHHGQGAIFRVSVVRLLRGPMRSCLTVSTWYIFGKNASTASISGLAAWAFSRKGMLLSIRGSQVVTWPKNSCAYWTSSMDLFLNVSTGRCWSKQSRDSCLYQ